MDDPEAVMAAQRFRDGFAGALDNDLNAPEALAALHVLVREGNRLLDEAPAGPRLRAAWSLADDVLAVAPTSRARTVAAEPWPWRKRTAFRSAPPRCRPPTVPTVRRGPSAGPRFGLPKSGPGTSGRRTGFGTC